MSSLTKPFEQMQEHYDAVVIGSGYGGGVAASRLSRMGLKVCVLEKGRQWRPGEFSNSFKGLWDRSVLTGRFLTIGPRNALFDLRAGRQMHILSACGLGGGSLVNAGLAFAPEPWVFEQKQWPAAVSQDGHLQTGFERAREMLGVSHCPHGEDLLKFRSLQNCATELKKDWPNGEEIRAEPVPSTISYAPGFNRANVMQNACTLCGDCWMGCNTGAKNTVTTTYLADAVNHGASLFTGADVDFVRSPARGQWLVYFEKRADRNGRRLGRGAVRADMVILSAGVVGSCEIMMRSREQGLALSPMLGKGVSANGDDLAFGHDMPWRVNGVAVGYPPRADPGLPVGPNCIGMITLKERGRPENTIRLQAGTMISPMASLAPFKSLFRGRALRALAILFNGAYKEPLDHTQSFYIVGHDDAGGEFRLHGGRALLFWPRVADQQVFGRAEKILRRLLKGLGAEYMQNPVRDFLLGGKPVTVHPLGGCRMGEDADRAVVDHLCRVFDTSAGDDKSATHEGFYIVDGSVIPTSLGANPLLAITALAERAMILLARQRRLSFDTKAKVNAPKRDAFMP